MAHKAGVRTSPRWGVVSNRNHSYGLLKAGKECVINIPTVEIARQIVACGNTSGQKTDKFKKLGLPADSAALVSTPLIRECYANLECRVSDTRIVADYCFFVLEVIKAWRTPSVKDPKTLHQLGRGNFMVASERVRIPSKAK